MLGKPFPASESTDPGVGVPEILACYLLAASNSGRKLVAASNSGRKLVAASNSGRKLVAAK